MSHVYLLQILDDFTLVKTWLLCVIYMAIIPSESGKYIIIIFFYDLTLIKTWQPIVIYRVIISG